MPSDPDTLSRVREIVDEHEPLDCIVTEEQGRVRVVLHSRRGRESKQRVIDALREVAPTEDRGTRHGRHHLVVDVSPVGETTPDDINEKVVRDWVAETTPDDRVWSVMRRTYRPQSVTQIADRARVVPVEVRHILQQLRERGDVTELFEDEEARYRRSPASLRRELRDL